ncbi:MAG: zinc ribbon domain-containing protein [Planctomycetota bacterium]
MPIYEFNCKDCGRDCEVLVRGSSTEPTCPDCGSDRLEKKLSLFAAKTEKGTGPSCSSCTSSSCSACRR